VTIFSKATSTKDR